MSPWDRRHASTALPSLNRHQVDTKDWHDTKILLVVGTHPEVIKRAPLLRQHWPRFTSVFVSSMAFAHNPYGDGFACERIAQTLLADKSLFPLAPVRSGHPIPLVPV